MKKSVLIFIVAILFYGYATSKSGSGEKLKTVPSYKEALDKIPMIEKKVLTEDPKIIDIYNIDGKLLYFFIAGFEKYGETLLIVDYNYRTSKIDNVFKITVKNLFKSPGNNWLVTLAKKNDSPFYIFAITNFYNPGIYRFYSRDCIILLSKSDLELKYKNKDLNALGWELPDITSPHWKKTSEIGYAYQKRTQVLLDNANKLIIINDLDYHYNLKQAEKLKKETLGLWNLNEKKTIYIDYTGKQVEKIAKKEIEHPTIFDTGIFVADEQYFNICTIPLSGYKK